MIHKRSLQSYSDDNVILLPAKPPLQKHYKYNMETLPPPEPTTQYSIPFPNPIIDLQCTQHDTNIFRK